MSSSLYKKALIIGATSGIGLSLASKLLSTGTHVILVGRRQDRLSHFHSTQPSNLTTTVPFDITDPSSIPSFAKDLSTTHPDIDVIVLNSGIQRVFDLSHPETINLSTLDLETTTNYTSYVHLTTALLPLLQAQSPTPTSLVYISATLGLVPGLLRTPNYNATKTALHSFILCLREKLKDREDNNVKVIEVFPPAVQTELHDEKHQPETKNGGKYGMPLEAFTEQLWEGLNGGEEQVAVGPAEGILKGWEKERQDAFHRMVEAIKVAMKDYLKGTSN
ncbi:putative short-chain dehydrogenase [Phaeomoniella chlamydospora]|uniref:Putative short-chain dehydrogenase n=1 Tax=Phaeomoniella chlamydospora TaxID=158046 RepID=A0A0G2EP12_PHACM|nr:putative short-chain dehydrogenase [Phaeomoniella chlamydospora]